MRSLNKGIDLARGRNGAEGMRWNKKRKVHCNGEHKYNVTVPGQNQPQKINRPRRKGAYTDEMISPVRSRRNVWQINTASYRGGHFAAFPPKLAETCILSGCPVGGIVLDPFLGSGTTAAAAKSLSRRYIGIELNPDYCELAKQRIGGDED